jgi:hypothetical protein
MRTVLLESVVRNITHRVVKSLCEAASLETNGERPMMSGERFDEILMANGIDENRLSSMLDLDWEDFYEIDYDYEVKLIADYDSFIESVWINDDFLNFISGLTTISEAEKIQILDGDVEVEDSKILGHVYEQSVEVYRSTAEDEAEDSYQYNTDPYSYYGVSPSDFVSIY